jgi:integrase/recombinase XerD
MNLDVLIHRYQQQLEILNRSPQTWRTVAGYLRLLQKFFDETKIADVQAVTSATLHDFQRWLFHLPTWKGTMRAVASQNRALSGVSGFFAFLHEEGILARNPAEKLTLAREPETLPRNVLTPQEARKIIEQPDTKTVLGYRDRAILETLYATGLRKSELMHLTLADVNLEEELLRINGGKGAKDRVSPLTQVACSFLENYIKGIRPVLLAGKTSDGGPACNALFISLRGQPISKNTLAALVEKYARLAKVKKHVTCHLWRHSCATHLVKNKANLRHVQEILGHRSLATTERYLHLTITDLKEAHRKHHPREIGGRAQALAGDG